MNTGTALIAFAILISAATSVYSIECYVCRQKDNPNCATTDPTELSRYAKNCDLACGTAAVDFETLDRCATLSRNGLITRSCYYRDPRVRDNACTSGNDVTACLCATDRCNGGSAA